jgi:hypothetical protein
MTQPNVSHIGAADARDPVFAMIDAHRTADAAWLAATYRQEELETRLPRGLTQSTRCPDELIIVETDDAEFKVAIAEAHRTSTDLFEIEQRMANTMPTTREGLMALLDYVAERIRRLPGIAWPMMTPPADIKFEESVPELGWEQIFLIRLAAAVPHIV